MLHGQVELYIPIGAHHILTKAHLDRETEHRMADKASTASLLSELGVEDLYGFIGVQPDASEKEVLIAYCPVAVYPCYVHVW